MSGHPRSGVFGVEDCVGDQLSDLVVVEAVKEKMVVPSRRVRTSRAIRNFARC